MSKPTKPTRAFQLPVEDEESAPVSKPDVASEATSSSTAGRPTYRKGKRNLSVWIDEKAFNTFKSMVAEEGSTIQDYVIKMINQEFAKKGRPSIAK